MEKIMVSGIIVKEKEILLIKRGKHVHLEPRCWFVPGGKGENGESPEEAIIREIREELNLEFIPSQCIQQIQDYGYEVYKYIGTYSGNITLQESELDGYGWFTYSEANQLNLAFDMKEVLELLYSKGLL